MQHKILLSPPYISIKSPFCCPKVRFFKENTLVFIISILGSFIFKRQCVVFFFRWNKSQEFWRSVCRNNGKVSNLILFIHHLAFITIIKSSIPLSLSWWDCWTIISKCSILFYLYLVSPYYLIYLNIHLSWYIQCDGHT